MTRYVLRRLVSMLPVIIGVTALTFVLAHAAGGEIVPGLLFSPELTPADIEQIRRNLGLDRPLHIQYLNWLWDLMRLDFGVSMVDGRRVTELLAERLPNTLLLTATAFVLGAGLSIPVGIAAAKRRGELVDRALTVLSVLGFSVPQFWLGLILILIFSIQFRYWGLPALPTGGATSAVGGGDLLDRIVHVILPATVLAFFYICVWSRFMRSSMIEVLSQEYITTARAKGLRERRVTYGHGLRNAIIPLVTLLGLELPGLVSGGLVVEVVFSFPGVGYLAYQRALQYDYTMVLGTTTFVVLLVVLSNLLADVVYAVVDPRLRHS